MKKSLLAFALVSSMVAPSFAQTARPSASGSGGQNGGGNSHSEKSQSQQSKSNSNNNAGGANGAGNALGVSASAVGVTVVAAGAAIVFLTVKLIVKVSSKALNAVAMNEESDQAVGEIAAIYNARGYKVSNEQVETAIFAVMDESAEKESTWNELFNNPEVFSQKVFTKLTGQQI